VTEFIHAQSFRAAGQLVEKSRLKCREQRITQAGRGRGGGGGRDLTKPISRVVSDTGCFKTFGFEIDNPQPRRLPLMGVPFHAVRGIDGDDRRRKHSSGRLLAPWNAGAPEKTTPMPYSRGVPGRKSCDWRPKFHRLDTPNRGWAHARSPGERFVIGAGIL